MPAVDELKALRYVGCSLPGLTQEHAVCTATDNCQQVRGLKSCWVPHCSPFHVSQHIAQHHANLLTAHPAFLGLTIATFPLFSGFPKKWNIKSIVMLPCYDGDTLVGFFALVTQPLPQVKTSFLAGEGQKCCGQNRCPAVGLRTAAQPPDCTASNA